MRNRRIISSANQKRGKNSEAKVKRLLEYAGFCIVQKLATPVKIVQQISPSIAKIYFEEKVTGDFVGCTTNGTHMHCECKCRGERLRWSDLEKHQIEHLDEVSSLGGTAVVAFVDKETWAAYLMRWPIAGFKPRKSIKIEQMEKIAFAKMP